MANDHILTLSCPDKSGIVHAVTGIFASHKHNILDPRKDPATALAKCSSEDAEFNRDCVKSWVRTGLSVLFLSYFC